MTTIKLIKNNDSFSIKRDENEITITLENNILDSKVLFEKIFESKELNNEFKLVEVTEEELNNEKLTSYYNDVKNVLDNIIKELLKLELS